MKGHNRTKCVAANIAFYSSTSSAVASRVGGRVMPSALAVVRLMTSSNLVGCSTGMSAGLAPLRILSTTVARAPKHIRRECPVGQQPARCKKVTEGVNGRQTGPAPPSIKYS